MSEKNSSELTSGPGVWPGIWGGLRGAAWDIDENGLVADPAGKRFGRRVPLAELGRVSVRPSRVAKSAWVAFSQFCSQHRVLVFCVCCLIIALVAVLDTWLVVKYSDSIHQLERNPICLFLIQQDPYDLMVFVYGKSAGNVLVLGILVGLFRYWERIAMPVTWAVTLFQLSLVCYLYVLSDLPHYYLLYIDSP